MRKIVSFMHVSLDGFVAGLNGEMDWIHVDDEIFDFAGDRTNNADTAIYGRVTFDMMDAYWPTAADQPNAGKHEIEHGAWYNNVDKLVISKTMNGQQRDKTTVISHDIDKQIGDLKKKEGKEIIMFGSPGATQTLMQFNLVDEFWLFVNPVLLGEGIPLFKGIKDKVGLKLLNSHAFTSGVMMLHYEKK
ncbi:dihydrofolate reductase family protein [Chitinophaga sp. 22321]|uniref:Dihydrofolate reductase family protein n=1 Tax=Chitinophaga hostae TaxID=2831022 RepID=A0ABS5J404_9BACT|nr:dihydrofolate reductase family protein [Chitinophaga hostae]MBS0029958.1 dihydrofolate reductase family protein [Chitinophaga hostae]